MTQQDNGGAATVTRLAREIAASESEIWDEASQSYRNRWMDDARALLAARSAK